MRVAGQVPQRDGPVDPGRLMASERGAASEGSASSTAGFAAEAAAWPSSSRYQALGLGKRLGKLQGVDVAGPLQRAPYPQCLSSAVLPEQRHSMGFYLVTAPVPTSISPLFGVPLAA